MPDTSAAQRTLAVQIFFDMLNEAMGLGRPSRLAWCRRNHARWRAGMRQAFSLQCKIGGIAPRALALGWYEAGRWPVEEPARRRTDRTLPLACGGTCATPN